MFRGAKQKPEPNLTILIRGLMSQNDSYNYILCKKKKERKLIQYFEIADNFFFALSLI